MAISLRVRKRQAERILARQRRTARGRKKVFVSARTKSLPISQPEVSGTPSRNRSESTAIPSPEEARTTGRLSRERKNQPKQLNNCNRNLIDDDEESIWI